NDVAIAATAFEALGLQELLRTYRHKLSVRTCLIKLDVTHLLPSATSHYFLAGLVPGASGDTAGGVDCGPLAGCSTKRTEVLNGVGGLTRRYGGGVPRR